MTGNSESTKSNIFFNIIIISITIIVSFFAILSPLITSNSTRAIAIGDVNQQDILAPYTFTYESDVLTGYARDDAEKSVAPVYLPPDPSIIRKQAVRLQATLAFITAVKNDSFSSNEEKMADLSALSDIRLTHDTEQILISLDKDRWELVKQEIIRVYELAMRNSIRENRLRDFQRTIPSLVSFSFPDDQAAAISEIASSFITPNSLFSEDLTQQAIIEAKQSINPVNRTFMSGEIIISRGDIITDLNYEALEKFGLVSNENTPELIMGAFSLVLIVGLFLWVYSKRLEGFKQFSTLQFALLAGMFLVFLVPARVFLPGHSVLPYLYPLPAFAMTISYLLGPQLGIIFSIILSIFSAYSLSSGIDLTLFYLITSIFSILFLGKGTRIASFFWSGIIVGITGTLVILAFRFPLHVTDVTGILTLSGAAFFSGMASAGLSILLQFLGSNLFGMSTALRLLDISRSDHPLLQQLLLQAPGSYQHSLMIANMAEQAAKQINADSLLVRVGSLYHDTGKLLNPMYFIENQPNGFENPHDSLDPEESAEIILNHVPDGVKLAKKHRLPNVVINFIKEHHGTLLTNYQYSKAVNNAGGDETQVDKEVFRYAGPPPRSRETALVMLADGCEARARSMHPTSEAEVRSLVVETLSYLQSEGQLAMTTFTFRDINQVINSFVNTLTTAHHVRIKYPEIVQKSKPALDEP